MNIKILGTGCPKCENLEKRVNDILRDNKINADVEKVSNLQEIIKYGILMTPGLVINEKVKSYGTIPKDTQILEWIKEAQ